MLPDLNRNEFTARLRGYGFHRAGAPGVWRLPRPHSRHYVCELTGGKTLRGRLAWLLREWDRITVAAALTEVDRSRSSHQEGA